MGKQSLMLLQWVQHHGAARRLMHASGVGQQRHAPRNDTYLSHAWCLPRAEAEVLPLHTHHKSPESHLVALRLHKRMVLAIWEKQGMISVSSRCPQLPSGL